MARVTLRTEMEGGKRVAAILHDVGGALYTDLTPTFRALADKAARAARRAAPKQSGALRRSIRPISGPLYAAVSAGGAAVPYAGAINYGWPSRGIRAALFMQTADAIIRPQVEGRIRRGVEAIIDKKWARK